MRAPHPRQVISFFREPAERCISSWAYEAKLCTGPHRNYWMHARYCGSWRAQYLDGLDDPATHLRYAERLCVEHITNELVRFGVDGSALLGASASPGSAWPHRQAQFSHWPTQPGLLNQGRDCWLGCHKAGGYCPSLFCGRSGLCCKKTSGASSAGASSAGASSAGASSAMCDAADRGCSDRHCCVAAPPPTAETPALAFFGIAEAFDASICLFWFQAGVLGKHNWHMSNCTCARRGELRASLQQYDAIRTKGGTRTQFLRASNAPELNVSREVLHSLNPGDLAFYKSALRIFEGRVAAVEAVVSHRFYNCD